MIWLILLSIFIIAAYTVAVCVKMKVTPYSISATFYALGNPWIFTLAMWLAAILVLPAALELGSGDTCAFLACGGMLLVGASPNFKDKTEGLVHDFGAFICLAGSQLYVMVNHPYVLMAWAGWIVYTIVRMSRHVTDSLVADFIRTKPMFWVEIVALATTYVSILLNV